VKCAVEMGSRAMICIQSFVKIGSAIQKLLWRDIQRDRSLNPAFIFQNKEIRLKNLDFAQSVLKINNDYFLQ
jgi:hypothetical protein